MELNEDPFPHTPGGVFLNGGVGEKQSVSQERTEEAVSAGDEVQSETC